MSNCTKSSQKRSWCALNTQRRWSPTSGALSRTRETFPNSRVEYKQKKHRLVSSTDWSLSLPFSLGSFPDRVSHPLWVPERKISVHPLRACMYSAHLVENICLQESKVPPPLGCSLFCLLLLYCPLGHRVQCSMQREFHWRRDWQAPKQHTIQGEDKTQIEI
jgi:hypothetical protein